jgi:glutathione S-transferase
MSGAGALVVSSSTQRDEPYPNWQLLSFPPSNDCDLARWVLDRYGVPYTERLMTVVFLQLKSKKVGGAPGFPALYRAGSAMLGFEAILDHFEPLASAERKLYPTDRAQASEVDRLWKKYHLGIGFAAARWAYSLLLPHRSLMVEPLARGCPWYQRLFVWLLYPLVAKLIGDGLQVPKDASDELAQVRAAFDEVDTLLADGRAFLVGSAPTILDFGFAAMAVPAVWPPEYGGSLPQFDRLPEALRKAIVEFRERPAGKFALKMYRDFRVVKAARTQ